MLLLDIVSDDWGAWWELHGWAIICILIVAIFSWFFIRRTVQHIVRPAVARQMPNRPAAEIDRRADTLSGVLIGTAKVIIVILAALTILPEFGVNTSAIVAGVGITSLALSLGAQSIVRDCLNGIFILSENQYAVGETITIVGVTGKVEEVTLRRTLIRDFDGVLHSMPNGTITTTSNHTRDFARVRVMIPVAHGSDMEQVRKVADRVGEELSRDPHYGPMIIEPPKYLRIETIDLASGVSVNVNGTVVPGRQWEVEGALRARLLEAFQSGGVKTPWG